jgi:hypothetical protein
MFLVWPCQHFFGAAGTDPSKKMQFSIQGYCNGLLFGLVFQFMARFIHPPECLMPGKTAGFGYVRVTVLVSAVCFASANAFHVFAYERRPWLWRDRIEERA